MSDLAKKLHNAVRPSKPLISSPVHRNQGIVKKEPLISSPVHRNQGIVKKEPLISSPAHKYQGIVKKEKDFASPARSISKFTASVSSGKGSFKPSKVESDKKGKKVYELPGQKHDPPEERDPLRIFYGSLYRQNPKSEMAQIWMMEHGLLQPEAAKKALERKKKSQLNQKLGLPAKSSKSVTTFKSEKIITKGMVVTPDRKFFTSNGDNKVLSKVKRKLDMASDSDDDKPLRPKKKLNTHT